MCTPTSITVGVMNSHAVHTQGVISHAIWCLFMVFYDLIWSL